MDKIKIISLVLLVILILNMVLIGLGKIPIILFWIIIGLGAVFAYWILPKMRAKKEQK